MIKMMSKIKTRNVILTIALVTITFILKLPYIDSLYEGNYISFIKQVLFKQGDNLIANVFWLFPIVGSLFLISNYGYNQLIGFNTRHKNRKIYIKSIFYKMIIYSLIFHGIFSILQIIIFSKSYGTHFDLNVMNVVLQYIIENTFLSLLVIFISIVIKRYIYAYILVLTGLIILLRVPKLYGKWIPFICLNYTDSTYLITIISCVVLTMMIYKLYLHCDIGGNYEN